MADNEKLGVYKAILAVATEISKAGISKDRRNQDQKFNFRGIDDFLNVLSPILSKEKLVIFPTVLSREVVQRTTKSGSALFFVTLQVEYKLVSVEDGSSHSVIVYGEAQDSSDKATNKALSAAYKYMAIQVFCIPLEGSDDADGDSAVDLDPDQKPTRPANAGSSAPAPVKNSEPAPEHIAPKLISEDKALTLDTLLTDAKLSKATLLKFYGVKSLEELTIEQGEHAFGQIEIAKKRKPN